MGGGNRRPEEISGDSFDESEISDHELPPIVSSVQPKPCDACVTAYERARLLFSAKDSILRYKPGDFIEEKDGINYEDYEIPDMTLLLLIGPKGSGKTTLVRRITKLFDSDPFCSDQDQESYNSSESFTIYLKEYTIPKRGSRSICIYDTPGLGEYSSEYKMWMSQGVRNGAIWSDGSTNIDRLDKKGQQKKKVNYAIFVVDAISVLKSMENNGDKQYIDLISEIHNFLLLSFKGYKPAVVITHGDKLSSSEFSSVHKELFCYIHPSQIFSIPDLDDYDTELNILRLLHYCVDKADKSLELKPKPLKQDAILQWSARMTDRLIIHDKKVDGIIVFLCIFILLLRFYAQYGT